MTAPQERREKIMSKICSRCQKIHLNNEFIFGLHECVKEEIMLLRKKNKILRAQLKALSSQQVIPFSGEKDKHGDD